MSRTRSRSLTGLIALNAALLVALGAVAIAPRSHAQNRARNQYAMVAGAVNGQTAQVVYIVDETGQELVGLLWDDSKRDFVGMGFRNMNADATEINRARN